MKVDIEPNQLKEIDADDRGRINLGSEHADSDVQLFILEPDIDGTSTSEYAKNHSTRDGWEEQRQKCLERDGYECRACGMSQEKHREDAELLGGLHVHHVTPARGYEEKHEAHAIDNLVTLCHKHHMEAEREGLPRKVREELR